MKDIEEIARNIVHCAIKVHKALGPGLLESVYQQCLAYDLEKVGLTVACEVPRPLKNVQFRSRSRRVKILTIGTY